MNQLFKNKTVFFSCADKEGVPEMAEFLYEFGFTVYSAGNTAKLIAGTVPVTSVADLPGGVGDMLNHRLLTLQPCVHGPLLASNSEEDSLELQKKGLPSSYDLVVADFYSFEKSVAKYRAKEITLSELWEKIDVGGPAMVKSAIKGLKFPVVTKERRDGLVDWIRRGCPNLKNEHRDAVKEAIGCVCEREKKHASFIHSLSQADFDLLAYS